MVAAGNGDAGGGVGVELGSRTEVDGVLESANGKSDSRGRSASEGSNDDSGKSKRARRSADEVRAQNGGPAVVQIDSPPPSPRESQNPDADIVASQDRRPLQVIQNVDVEASADAHSPKREPDTDTPSLSPIGAVDPSL